MSHPLIVSGNGQAKYQALLQEAETERLYRKVTNAGQKQKRFSLSSLFSGGQIKRTTGRPALESK